LLCYLSVLVLYAILLFAMLALIGAAFAFHVRIKRHMKGPGETQRREPYKDKDEAIQQPGPKSS